MNISYEIERLVQYGLNKGLLCSEDIIYTRNRILEVLGLDEIENVEIKKEELESPDHILDNIMEWAEAEGRLTVGSITYRDLFDTKIMACLMPRPSEVIEKFRDLYKEDSKNATDYFYNLSKASNYIRIERVKKDLRWKTSTEYGDLDITINLSKPEKDPKAIAAAGNAAKASYPKCVLCKENEGYAGRINHPARQNHRIIPIVLNNEEWYIQYSPYVYYNEHCIVFKGEHEPMKVSRKSFIRLLDFVGQFPHYFIGSNAGLPIVGGSILSHDHFQGGRYQFAMAKAEFEKEFKIDKFPEIRLGKVKWPMSVLRLEGEDKDLLIEAADYVFCKWKEYSDETVDIISKTGDTPHNTVTPIARKKDSNYQLDLVLRNNRTSEEYPDGIFHPHRELHHIKKENIGLIEVMGLAVLPGRLIKELDQLSKYLISRENLDEIDKDEDLRKHKEWCVELINKYPVIERQEIDEIIKKEVGLKFLKVLEDAGVFKRDEKGQRAFDKFVGTL